MTVNPDRYLAAAMRHLNAYRNGETFDPESGENHLAHVISNLAFLLERDEVEGVGE